MAARNNPPMRLSAHTVAPLLLSALAMLASFPAAAAGPGGIPAFGQVDHTVQMNRVTAKGTVHADLKHRADREDVPAAERARESAVSRNDARSEALGGRKADAIKAPHASPNRDDDADEDKAEDEIYSHREDQGALVQTQSAVGQVRVKSWKTLRDTGIVKQDLDYSCGAASAATLLNSFYGQRVSEKAFLKAMGEEDGMASFEDMAKAMPKFGFKAQGFAASWEQLRQLKIPVIVYVKYRKDDHFSVLRGISGDTVWLADPSLGNRTFSKAQFLQMWQTRKDGKAPELAGKLLAVLPAKADISRMEHYFSKAPRRQSASAVAQLAFRGTR